ncbi:MAG: hypothetical protein WC378_17815 [Opitutaceae bacterium]|jgi:hypothetical protein
MKTTVIYHSADYDGIFCREIARKFLGEKDVEFIGWNYGNQAIEIEEDGNGKFKSKVYIMDLSPDCVAGLPETWTEGIYDDPVIWIDHHKTSIETWPKEIPGYRIDGVAACRLAWQWFSLYASWDPRELYPPYPLPAKQDFIDRKVSEPLSVRLAGEYDIWDKRDPDAWTFQYGIRIVDEGADFWEALLRLDPIGEKAVFETLENGRIAQRYAVKTDAGTCKSRTWIMEWEGLKFLCINSARFNSLVFAARDLPETGHDALMGFCFDGKQWNFSLYHAKHKTDLDLSVIAKKYGGGGHRGACGFRCDKLPW